MSQNTNPTCPTGCGGILPQMEFDYCNPVLAYGQIDHVFLMAYNGECFSDWTSLTEWLARLSNTSADVNAIRFLHVIGDKPLPEREETEISLGRKVKSPASNVINIDIDDVSDLNYEFMRVSQCNTIFKMWFSAGDYLFGGVCGIDALVNLDYIIERGTKSIQKISGTITWESKYSPERCANPLAGNII